MDTAQQFSIANYFVFGGMLTLSTLIGVYFGFFAKKKPNTTKEYLLGGKSINFFPIAASLIASHLSGATFLAVPAEVYGHGSEYVLSTICAVFLGLALIYIYLPVFYDLQLISSFQYLEMRFCRKIRLLSSFIYIFSGILISPIVLYVPALAFSQVSGINLHYITVGTSIVCIFYTTVGGLKAVVWTDTLQFVLMVGGVLCVTVLGLLATGGFENVWKTSDTGGRLIFFNMNPSPFVRTSFWTYTIGMSTTWIGKNGISQCCIQRFLAVSNINSAKKAVWMFVFGLSIIKLVSCFGGLIIYTFYELCDPVASGKIEKVDQILPFFIMQTSYEYPGLPGLFIAGVFSAALSSISSTLNTTAGTIYEDFIRPCFPNATEKRASNVMKLFVVILGLVMLSLVFVVEKMGQIFRLNFVISGMFVGTQLGLFSIGMMSRTANTKGVICGAAVALITVGTIIIGAQSLPKQPPLKFKTEGCNSTLSSTTNEFDSYQEDLNNVPLIFQLSFMYYTILAAIVLFLVALPVSFLTGGCEPFDERLLTPFLRNKAWKENKIETKETLYKKLDLKSIIEMKKINDPAKVNQQ